MQLNNNCSDYQHTLASEISISGVGIHTGQTVEIKLIPAEPNTGIVFKRIDLEGQPSVKADVDNVVETTRSTTIEAARICQSWVPSLGVLLLRAARALRATVAGYAVAENSHAGLAIIQARCPGIPPLGLQLLVHFLHCPNV